MPYKLMDYSIMLNAGEPIRYMLNHCGIKFEDDRLSYFDWVNLKLIMPMGDLLFLDIDGKQYHDAKPIGRFIAKKCNLYGSDEFEAIEIDAIVDSIEYLNETLSICYCEQKPIPKEERKKALLQQLPYFFNKFEAQVKKNGGYFVGGKLSWADFMLAGYSDYFNFIVDEDSNKDHPELKKLVEKVRALPNVKAYLENRPKILY